MTLLEVEPLDLGSDVRAIGLELVDPEDHEPVHGADGAAVWSRVFPALAGAEPWALDFFAHTKRVREYCEAHSLELRESGGTIVVIPPEAEALAALLQRFETETFGVRCGGLLRAGDTALEKDLARRGLDAYHATYSKYAFCLVCELDSGWVVLLSDSLWAQEAIRRVRPALAGFDVEVQIPA